MGDELVPFALALAATGVFTGFVAGLLGLGGGIIVVPVLYAILPHLGVAKDARMHVAVGTSLAVIVATTLVSAWSHARIGNVDGGLFRRIAPPLLVGAILGTLVAGLVSGHVLAGIFGGIVLLIAFYMAFFGTVRISDHLPGHPLREIATGVIGLLCVIMGVGGGSLMVPFLAAYGFDLKKAVGTSAALSPVIAGVGVVGFAVAGWGVAGLPPASLGYVNALGFVMIAPIAMALAPVGARVARGLPQRSLRIVFAVFLAATGLDMLYDAGLARVFSG